MLKGAPVRDAIDQDIISRVELLTKAGNTPKIATFRIGDDHEDVMKETLTEVFDALQEKGYNPINQIVGYILTEDPTYITTHNNARSLIRRLDRDELLAAMVKSYLD